MHETIYGMVHKASCATHVPVQYEHALYPWLVQGSMRRHCHIVEEAEAHQLLRLGVVAGRPHDGKGGAHLTTQHSTHGLQQQRQVDWRHKRIVGCADSNCTMMF